MDSIIFQQQKGRRDGHEPNDGRCKYICSRRSKTVVPLCVVHVSRREGTRNLSTFFFSADTFFFPTFTIFSFLKSRPIWIGHSNSFIRSGYFGNETTAAPQPQAADRRTNGDGRWRSVSRKVTQGVLPRATKKHGPQLRDCYAQSSVAFRTLSCYVACLVRRRVS